MTFVQPIVIPVTQIRTPDPCPECKQNIDPKWRKICDGCGFVHPRVDYKTTWVDSWWVPVAVVGGSVYVIITLFAWIVEYAPKDISLITLLGLQIDWVWNMLGKLW
jgi:hypothetical protein